MKGDKLNLNSNALLSSAAWKFLLLTTLLLKVGNISFAQCSGGTASGALTSPNSGYQTATYATIGLYKTFTAVEGAIYNFTLCSGGGSASYDTEITILDNSGNFTADGYNDDYCGLLSDLTWIAPSSGIFRVLITQFGCVSTGAFSAILAYKEISPQYYGGNKDGWTSIKTSEPTPLSNIYTGGNGQGWASVKTSELTTLSNFYVGGTDDGWSVGAASISDPPTVTITSTATDPTNLTSIPVTITFSESVTGFIAGDITVTNGTAGSFAGSGATYTTSITPTAAGPVTVSVAANKATDAATLGNIVSNTLSLTYDNVAPTVSITTTATNPTNLSSIPVIITFSESMTGFIVGDITVTNGTAGSFAGSGATYTASITPTAAGPVTVNITANKATDAAANGNIISNTLTLTYDNIAPTVSITTTATDPTTLSSIPITITFSESVTGFALSDITVTNGTAGVFTGSGTTYTAGITPTAAGPVTVTIAANNASDAAANGNIISNTLTLTYDNVAPTVSITSTATDPTNLSPIPVTITFSESVTGFIVGDITVTNGTAGNFAGSGTTYTTDITPTAAGQISISIAAGKASDAATLENTVSNTLTLTYDNVAPTVSITSTVTDPTNLSSIPVTITFSESVTGFIVGDITVTNGTAGSFTGSGSTYTANITPTAAGQVIVSISSNKAADAATNINTASNTLTWTYDNVAPPVSLSTTATNPTTLSLIPVTITFSESVTGFILGDINVTNGTAMNFAGSGATYTVSIAPVATGLVTVSIIAGKAIDAASNGNLISNTLSLNYTGVPILITNESFLPTFNKGGTLTVSISVNDASKVSKVNFLSRGISEPASALKIVEVSASGNKFEKVVTAADLTDPIGLHYYFEVIDQSQLTIPSSKGKAYVKYLSTNTEQVIPNLRLGNQVSDYQMISIPLELTNKSVSEVFKSLIPYDSTKWRLFDYINGNNREYVKWSSNDNNIKSGKAYWLIFIKDVKINPGEGTAVLVDETNPFIITLLPGWNLIGNPYNFNISWDEVLTASGRPAGVGRFLSVFSGGALSDGTTLDRYRGAFVENTSTSSVQIKVPVLRNKDLNGGKVSGNDIDLENTTWDLPISISNGLLTNERGGIGMHPKASLTGKDDFDKVSVPLLEGLDMPELVFSSSNSKADLTKDVVPAQNNFTWSFTVKQIADAPVKLTWPTIEQKGDKQLILVDLVGQRMIDMTSINEINLLPVSKSFKVFFGDPDYIVQNLDKELPAIGQPYPNPAHEEVKIPIYISEALDHSKVTVRIYSSTGAEVATLVDDYFGKGSHELRWKPIVENGLYFAVMKVGSGESKRVKIIIY